MTCLHGGHGPTALLPGPDFRTWPLPAVSAGTMVRMITATYAQGLLRTG